MMELSTNEMKIIQLEILDDFHSFCIKEGLRYSLCGGTMIGAVRHGGYIPWDDDIDLMMPRQDYDKFISSYSSKVNEVIDLSDIETCEEQFVKVSRKGTIMEDITTGRRLWGVNVDIFPIDGMPDNYIPYTERLQDLHIKVRESCPLYKAATRKPMYWKSRFLLKWIFKGRPVDVLFTKKIMNDIAHSNLPDLSPLSTVIFGDFRIFPFQSSVFQEYDTIVFEGKPYNCIKDRDLYLTKVYGNYMQLPPIEKRVTHHLYNAYLVE